MSSLTWMPKKKPRRLEDLLNEDFEDGGVGEPEPPARHVSSLLTPALPETDDDDNAPNDKPSSSKPKAAPAYGAMAGSIMGAPPKSAAAAAHEA